MPNIEEQNLTEFLLEVKAKMANITTSENYEIDDINEYVLKNSGKFIRSKLSISMVRKLESQNIN